MRRISLWEGVHGGKDKGFPGGKDFLVGRIKDFLVGRSSRQERFPGGKGIPYHLQRKKIYPFC